MDRFQTHKDAEKKDNTMIAEQYRKMLDAKSVIRQLSGEGDEAGADNWCRECIRLQPGKSVRTGTGRV